MRWIAILALLCASCSTPHTIMFHGLPVTLTDTRGGCSASWEERGVRGELYSPGVSCATLETTLNQR